MKSKFQSAVHLASDLAKKFPERTLYRFSDGNGKIVSSFTCLEIFSRALQIASFLTENSKIKKGERVLLVYPPGLEFVEAFWACLFAGIIPVPVPPPMPMRPEFGLPGYVALAKDSGAVAQLTCQSYSLSRSFGRILHALKSGEKWPDLPWIVTDTVKQKASESFRPVDPGPDDLALLQYTSGSTRSPRGVCITFGNIWAQTQLLKHDNHMRWERASVFWMPHYHDFALIGGIVCAMCGNYETILFAAESFLRRPALWGDLMSRYQASHTGAPDFGYHLFTRKTTPEQRAAWDLSPVRVMMSAAEPIRPKTVDALLAAFQVSHLNPDAFCPSYGLAEHTVAVSLQGRKRFLFDRASIGEIGKKSKQLRGDADPASGIELFGCGKPTQGVLVQIVNPETLEPLPDEYLGEIWVNSESKAAGYFSRPEETKEKFAARYPGSDLAWLRTGDLGLLCEGELVIVGRVDDMLIYQGKNFYPQDAEGLVSENETRVRAGRVLAFTTAEEERPFLVMELKNKDPDESECTAVAQSVRSLLQQEMGLAQMILIFSPHGTIPKTTSGKLQRNQCKSEWLAGRLAKLKVDRGI